MSITILLPLYNRPLHTLRWMWHADRVRLPFPIMVSDGGDEPAVKRVLSAKGSFPNLDYEYRSYRDHCYADFFRKLEDSVRAIRTPFTAIAENDDFLLPGAFSPLVDALRAQPDAAYAGTKVLSFVLRGAPGPMAAIQGRIARINTLYTPAPIGGDLRQRVMTSLAPYNPSYYSLYRTDALLAAFAEIVRLEFSHLDLWELFLAGHLAAQGERIALPGHASYIRQIGTSFAAQQIPTGERRIADPSWRAQLETLGQGLFASLASPERESCAAELTGILFARTNARKPRPQGFGLRGCVRPLAHLPLLRELRAKLERRTVLNGLAAVDGGAGRNAAIVDLAEVDATLCSPEFPRFVQSVAPELLT